MNNNIKTNEFFDVINDRFDNPVSFHFIGAYTDLVGNKDIFKNIDSKKFNFIFHKISFGEDFEFPQDFVGSKIIEFIDCTFESETIGDFDNANITFSKCDFLSGLVTFFTISNSTLYFVASNNFQMQLNNVNDSSVSVACAGNCELDTFNVNNIKFEIFDANEGVQGVVHLTLNMSTISLLKLFKVKVDELNVYGSNIDLLSVIECVGTYLFIVNSLTSDVLHLSELFLNGNEFERIVIKGNVTSNKFLIKKIRICDSKNIFIDNCNITSLVLEKGLNRKILVSNSSANELSFDSFIGIDTIDFDLFELVGESKLILNKSSLNKVNMSPSFMHQVKDLTFHHSTLKGLEIFNFKYLKTEVISASESSIEDKIDFVRELALLLKAQDNTYSSRLYKSYELELVKEQNDDSLTFIDKIIINLNFWSNVHGTMPQKALFWMLLMIVIMFGIINADLSFQTGMEYEAGFDFLSHNYSYFIKPFTFLSDVEQSYKPFNSENMQARFHPITKGFDFLFKIFYAYLLYQFIAAFRKFNK
tara:strand:+ start:9319 stop:10914 length:1596 start_codon:yes stop_codon:yes gene_type:complete